MNQTVNSVQYNRIERSWLHAKRVELVSPHSSNTHGAMFGGEFRIDQLRASLNTSPRSPCLIDGTIVGNKIGIEQSVTDGTNIVSAKTTYRK